MKGFSWVWAIGLAMAFAPGVRASGAALPVDDPAALARTHSLGRVIAEAAAHPVHIVFVHGIRAQEAGTAELFMRGLCRHAPVQCPSKWPYTPTEHHSLSLGAWPQKATVFGHPIWSTQADWEAGQPFVDRYVFRRIGAPPVVVDEVNWWPLLFPFKCRWLVAPEAALAGPDKDHLDLCLSNTAPYHPWITQVEYDAALKGPTNSGGGAAANRFLKQQIMDWGLSDAVIALGPMRSLIRKTMDGAFGYAARFEDRDVSGQEFVVVSESLGSFVVMDAAASGLAEAHQAQDVVDRTSDLYFFANQFALLELARIKDLSLGRPELSADLPGGAATAAEPAPSNLLKRWASPQANQSVLAPAPRPKQIIAFSDPSDILTFDVPPVLDDAGRPAATVVNVYDRNEFDWFGLYADPVKAHTGHSSNQDVLRMMFTP